jgi:dihydrofolate synthase / folylpolyglutamate synthase
MLSYRDALRAIFQRTDFERQNQPPYAERVWRLSRMQELLEQFDNPQQTCRAVHIAGTKGKGSTTAMIESVLRAAGYRTGMYTSPHLHTFRERIQAEGELIAEDDLARLVEGMLPILDERLEVTVFEIITALAMRFFAERHLDIGVFEVGMGGRLDATNVLQPLVAVITSISMDHMNVLGNTLEAIAYEKAGIIKPGIPTVSAPQQPAALQVVRDTCQEHGTALTLVGQDWQWRFLRADHAGQHLAVFRAGHAEAPEYPDLWIPLLGAHQLENASVAVAAVEVLRAQGLALGRDAVYRGLANVRWPGRLEVLGRNPLVVVDGAHNPYSIQCLMEALDQYLSFDKLHVIFGAGVTHNPQDLLSLLVPRAHTLYATRSRHAKATPVADLQSIAQGLGHRAVPTETVAEAFGRALDEAQPEDLVLVTGSLFVLAEAQEAWAARQGQPPFPADPPGVY